MKKLLTILLIFSMVISSSVSADAEEVDNSEDILTLENLISSGSVIPDTSNSAEAYTWVMNVYNFINKHEDYEYATQIKKECSTMMDSSYVYGEDKNRTIAYLTMNIENLKKFDAPTRDELISTGRTLSDTNNSSEAYIWVLHVQRYNQDRVNSQYNVKISNECSSMINSSYVYGENKNRTIAYLILEKEYEDAVQTKSLEKLISEGTKLSSTDNSVDAYEWVLHVQDYIEEHKDAIYYADVKKECETMIDSSYVYGENKNRTVAYLSVQKEYMDKTKMPNAEELISIGTGISDTNNSVDAYLWVLHTNILNEKHPESSVYTLIRQECETMIDSSYVYGENKNRTVAYLGVLADEYQIPVTTQLQSIRITQEPEKVNYNEGEAFSSKGMKVVAVYLNIYKDGSTDTEEKEISGYSVDEIIPLTLEDTSRMVSYTENGITKTAMQTIAVKPIIVSKTLKSISIATPPNKVSYKEGETFNKTGLKVNATYDQLWSDGTRDIEICENVTYIVDTIKKLTAQDSSIVVSFTDDGVTKTAHQAIIVENFMSCHSFTLTRCHKLTHFSVTVFADIRGLRPGFSFYSRQHLMLRHIPHHVLINQALLLLISIHQ